jgi:hypothetical protein
MANPTIRIHNIETDEIIDREMTNEEFAKFQADKAKQIAAQSETEAKEAARQAIAERLGLTADELQVLLG